MIGRKKNVYKKMRRRWEKRRRKSEMLKEDTVSAPSTAICVLHTCEGPLGNESLLQPSSHLDNQTGAQPRQLNYYINTGQPMRGDKQTVTRPQFFLLTPIL